MIAAYAAETVLWSTTALVGGFALVRALLWAAEKGRNQ